MTPEPHPDRRPESARAPASSNLRVVESTEGHVFGVVGNVVVSSWRQRASLRGLEAAAIAMREARGAAGGGFGLIGCAEPDAGLPDAEVRARMAELLRGQRPHLAAAAFLIEGDGFRAAAVRSVTTGLAILIHQPFPYRIFSHGHASATWLVEEMARHHVGAPSVGVVASALEVVRRAPFAR